MKTWGHQSYYNSKEGVNVCECQSAGGTYVISKPRQSQYNASSDSRC